MKIAIDCRMSGKSGIGVFLDNILPYFAKAGHELLLIGFSELPTSLTAYADYIKTLPCNIKMFSVKELLFFSKNILKYINTYDVYFSPYCNIPSGIKIPIYTTIHDVVFLDIPNLAGRIGTFIRKCFYKRAVKKSCTIFTVSEFSKQRITETLNCKKNIKVVYSSVPPYIEQPITGKELTKTESIIFIGNIKKHKGLQTLIPAFIEFRKQFNKNDTALPELIIVGSQENFRTQDNSLKTLQEKVSDSGIKFTGFISDEQLHILISRAKLLVQPSLYEGFGLPPLQALYCGTKVILSDIPVFKEIYKGFPVTYFATEDQVDLTEKISEVWNSKDALPEIPKKYSFQRTSELILDEFLRQE